MPKSESTLTLRQKEFLKSEKPLGFNKSQYQGDIEYKLKKSIDILQSILPNTRNLRKEKIYDIINSVTFEKIIKNLLIDVTTKRRESITEQGLNPMFVHYSYDYRTVELARLLLEASAFYLKRSSFVNKNKFLKEDIDKVLAHFQSLAETTFYNERKIEDISYFKKYSCFLNKLPDSTIKKMFTN